MQIYLSWFHFTLGQYIAKEIEIISNEQTAEYRVHAEAECKVMSIETAKVASSQHC